MEETEVEEGEAYIYPEKDEDIIDLDVHLSYIDEKIKVVLGHYQKDFEGGVSAENLGSKYGGYGSFLPSCQRSPFALSHPRTPQRVQNYIAPKSHNLQSEEGHNNAKVLSSTPLSVKPVSKASSNRDVRLSSIRSTVDLSPKQKLVDKSTKLNEQKTLKVRIKVGPDRLSAQTNAEIYRGLGLDDTPSSSLEDSSSESGELSFGSHNASDESPSSMLPDLIYYLDPGDSLLSPLSDSLMHLIEKGELLTDNRCSLTYKCEQESSATLRDGSPVIRDDWKDCGGKKIKSIEKKPGKVNKGNVKDADRGDSLSRKKIEAGTAVSSKSLKLLPVSKPRAEGLVRGKGIVSSSSDSNGKMIKCVHEKFVSDYAKDVTETTKVRTCSLEDVQFDTVKIGRSKVHKSFDQSIDQLEGSKGGKNLNAELGDPQKQKSKKKGPNGNEKPSHKSNIKPKGSEGNDFPAEEFPKESSKIGSSSSKQGKKTNEDYPSKGLLENKRLDKESEKTRESHTGFLGKTKIKLKKNVVDVSETPRSRSIDSVLHERPSSKKVESKTEVYLKPNLSVTPTENRPVSDAVPATETNVIEEEWVSCDRCEKWRLLPVGTNPGSFPDKWFCSMLNWLPGMNRCDISEEETTRAVHALYRLPVPENHLGVSNLSHGAAPEVTSGTVQNLDPARQGDGSHGGFGERKKKLKIKEAVNTAIDTYSAPVRNSLQKNLHDATQSQLESHPANRAAIGQSIDTKSSILNRKRGSEQDDFCVSKRSKMASCTSQDRINGYDQLTVNVGSYSTSGFSNSAAGKDVHKSNDMKCDSKERIPVSMKKKLGGVQVLKSNSVGIDSKKRKVEEWQESQTYPEVKSEHKKEKKARVLKSEGKESSSNKGCDKNDQRGKATRIILSSRSSIPHGMVEDVSGVEKNPQLGRYVEANTVIRRSLDGIDIPKKNMVYMQHSVTAASSSSKVSNSRRNKINTQEVKGSPVESVSSSPLRISNRDKVITSTRKLLVKDNKFSAGVPVKAIPRKCSNGEVDVENVQFDTLKADISFARRSMVSSLLEHHDRDANHTSGSKCNSQAQPSSCHADHPNLANVGSNDVLPRKSGKFSLQFKDKDRSSKSVSGEGDIKLSGLSTEHDLYQMQNLRSEEIGSRNLSYSEEPTGEKERSQEKFAMKSKKIEKNGTDKKDSSEIPPSEGRGKHQSNFGGYEGSSMKLSSTCSIDEKFRPKKDSLKVHETEEPSNKFLPDKTDPFEMDPGKRKYQSLPCSGNKRENLTHYQPIAGNPTPVDASRCSDKASQGSELPMKFDNEYETLHNSSKQQSTSNSFVVRDLETQTPVRKESSTQAAASAFKEAKDLKHSADRLKSNGLELESTGIYFQAALKFLHGASLLELCNQESTKHGETSYMIEMYSSTAKLCEFVAREYEKFKEMASAALAYKCMEVAYMKVVYSKNSTVSNDRHELQEALQMVPLGESPSSSSSGVDNSNNPDLMDKGVLAKTVTSPPVTGDQVISSQTHPSFVQLLNFAQNVNFALEASRKSQIALAAANLGLKECSTSSVKSAIDFTFHDIDGLLRLVRVAMETINH